VSTRVASRVMPCDSTETKRALLETDRIVRSLSIYHQMDTKVHVGDILELHRKSSPGIFCTVTASGWGVCASVSSKKQVQSSASDPDS
jgi:hypothetical protein